MKWLNLNLNLSEIGSSLVFHRGKILLEYREEYNYLVQDTRSFKKQPNIILGRKRIIRNSKQVFRGYFTFSGRNCTSLIHRCLPQKIKAKEGSAYFSQCKKKKARTLDVSVWQEERWGGSLSRKSCCDGTAVMAAIHFLKKLQATAKADIRVSPVVLGPSPAWGSSPL